MKTYRKLLAVWILLCFMVFVWCFISIQLVFSSWYEKELTICFLLLYILWESFVAYSLFHDVNAIRRHQEALLQEPRTLLAMLLLGASFLFACYFLYHVYEQQARFTQIVCALALSSYAITLIDAPCILFDKDRMYFHHHWIEYNAIQHIDFDNSVKRYVVVYIYEKKTYRERMKKELYIKLQKEFLAHDIRI